MDIINRINTTTYLGREFLTWLWYRSAVGNGIFHVNNNQMEVWFDRKLTLAIEGESMTIKADNPTETSESQASAIAGKVVTDATLRIVDGQKQWTLSIKGDSLGISGVKIPALLSREDDDQLYERFMLIEEIEDIMRDLFRQFIAIRTGGEWGDELEGIRAWIHRISP